MPRLWRNPPKNVGKNNQRSDRRSDADGHKAKCGNRFPMFFLCAPVVSLSFPSRPITPPGMADLQSTNPMPQPKANTPVTERPPFPLAHSFARESQKDPELALVFA